jgi:site-specific recombinase XerD
MMDYIAERVRTCQPEAFLFVNPRTGEPYSQEAYLGVWDLARKKAGVTDEVKLYASRHSIASQLGNENVPGHRISKALGHSKSSRSTEKYVHSDLEAMKMDLSRLSLSKRETVTRLSLREKGDEKYL